MFHCVPFNISFIFYSEIALQPISYAVKNACGKKCLLQICLQWNFLEPRFLLEMKNLKPARPIQ